MRYITEFQVKCHYTELAQFPIMHCFYRGYHPLFGNGKGLLFIHKRLFSKTTIPSYYFCNYHPYLESVHYSLAEWLLRSFPPSPLGLDHWQLHMESTPSLELRLQTIGGCQKRLSSTSGCKVGVWAWLTCQGWKTKLNL